MKAVVVALFVSDSDEDLRNADSALIYGISESASLRERFIQVFRSGDLEKLVALWKTCVTDWKEHADPTTLVRQVYQSAYCMPMVVDLLNDYINVYAGTNLFFGLGKTKMTLLQAHKCVSLYVCMSP